MYEPENLIMFVERHPCLWDIRSAEYHNRDVKDMAWEQICKDLFQDWETCSDKSNRTADLKKKWTHIRDYYRKDVQKTRNTPTGSAAKKSKKYIYSDLLHFLDPMFERKDTDGNFQNDSEPTEAATVHNTEPEDQAYTEPLVPTSSAVDNQPPMSEEGRKAKATTQNKNKKDVPLQILGLLQNKQKATAKASNTDEDDDTRILLSFKGYMKIMNTNQKIDFQLGILQLVKQVLGNNEASSQSPHNENSYAFPQSPHSFSYSPNPIPLQNTYHPNIASPSTPIHSSQTQPVPRNKPKLIIRSVTNVASPKYIIKTRQKHVNKENSMPDSTLRHSLPAYYNRPSTSAGVYSSFQHSLPNPDPEPEYVIPNNIDETNEDSEAVRFLINQSQDSRDTDDDSIENYLKFR